MKNIFFVLFLLYSGIASALDMSVTPLVFKGPNQSYLEVQLFVLGSSVKFVPINESANKAAVNVLMLVKQDTTIVLYEKYTLNSPETLEPINFVDVKRFGLSDGDYQLEVVLEDANDPTNTSRFNRDLSIGFDNNKMAFSDIQLLSSFRKDPENGKLSKNGIHLETLPYQFYTKELKKLRFYTELYNTDQFFQSDYKVRYRVELQYTNGRSRTMIKKDMMKSPAAVMPILVQHSIKDLASSNYRLVLEVFDENDAVISEKSVDFQVSNPNVARVIPRKEINVKDSFVEKLDSQAVRYSLKAIVPILDNGGEERINQLLKDKDLEMQKKVLLNFWTQQNQDSPDIMYNEYMKVARAVDETYKSGLGSGFESDRGYIFLKYGKPSDLILVEDEPSAPPYEIWFYNDFPTTNQHNVKFLFYNPSLAIGNFQLLHSTAIGEVNNPQWEVELYRDDTQSIQQTDFDTRRVPDNVGRRARRFFGEY